MKRFLLIISILSQAIVLNAQQIERDTCNFSSGNQNMWGPSFNAFTINEEIDIFNFPWNSSFDTGNSGIVSILGQQFGAGFAFGTNGFIGMKFTLEGFTTGEVAVDYPVEIELDMNTDLTYDQGDVVKIETSYEVLNTYKLETMYPSAGTAKLDLNFQVAANASMTVCAFSCLTLPMIPSFNTGTVTLNIFTVTPATVWFLGPACGAAIPYHSANAGPGEVGEPSPGQNVFPFSLPMAEDWCSDFTIPWQVKVDLLPLDLDNYCDRCGDFGIGGMLTLPYVETTDQLNPNNTLTATGDSNYFEFSIEIFKLIGGIIGELPAAPPPLEIAGLVLSNLSGSYTLPGALGTIYGAELTYNIMSANFTFAIFNKQRFTFDPKIYGKMDFPVPVEYWVYDGLGALKTSGIGAIVNYEIGDEINYKYPCYFAELAITPTYTIVGQFTNRTYDSLSFSFNFSALQFGFNLPAITILPAINIPSICFPLPYPCPTWSNPFRWCTTTVCTPAINIPAVVFGGFSWGFGPLIDESVSLADYQYDWFNQTWTLEGFVPITHPAFKMRARVFSAIATNTNVNCFGLSTGSINVTTVNGSSPFTYAWSNGANTEDLTNLPANNYIVTITDVNGCQTATGATVSQPSTALSVSLVDAQDKSCNGGLNDGFIDVLTQGGTSPYTYNWNSGLATTQDLTNIPNGIYDLVVTDSNGCVSNFSYTINQPSALTQTGSVTDVKCFGGSDGTATALASGGNAPYNYLWSNGQNSNNIANLTAGTYTLTVTDTKGCTNSANYAVGQPVDYPSVSLVPTTVSCFGGSDASINTTPTGGTVPYSFGWSNGLNQVLPNATEDLSGVSSGTYTITVTDANGCIITGNTTVTQPAAPLSATALLTDINCFGDNTGAIATTTVGGTSPYTYAWSNAMSTATINSIPAGNYTVTITDNRGCTENYTYTLNEPLAPLSGTTAVTDVLCFGNSTGGVSTSVNGGTAPYSYLWSNSATTSAINNLAAGAYSVTVTDSKGCTLPLNDIVNQPLAPLAISNTVVDVDCYGASTGSVDMTLTGGTTPYNYQWWDQTNQFMIETTEDLINKPIGNYTVVVTDANGCLISDTAIVGQPAAPLSMTFIMDDVDCYGNADGALDITTAGGTSPYTYSWSDGQTTEDAVNLSAGAYTVTITDFNNCILAENMVVTQPLSPLLTTIQPTAILCHGDLTGVAVSTTQGGTAPYTYSWSNGSTQNFIENVAAGPYSLTATDSKGCFTFTGTVIDQPAAALSAIPNVTDASCYEYKDGSIVLNVSGGTQPYTFEWSNDLGFILNNPSETLSALVASNYLARITDKNGCTWEQLITVGQPAPFVATIQSTPASCFNQASGSLDLTVTGGTLPYNYLWSNSATTEDITTLLAGEYSVVVTDDQGCIIRDTASVGQPLDLFVNYEIDPISCIDQSDASIDVLVAGGTQPYSYSWNTGETTQDISDLDEGDFTLTIIDAQGCIRIETFTIFPVDHECVDPVNTFTPNGDNYNDTWFIENLDLYPNAKVEVFNKWGNLVHSQQGIYKPWDGSYEGEQLPADVYYYIIQLNNNLENKYTGSITIIR